MASGTICLLFMSLLIFGVSFWAAIIWRLRRGARDKDMGDLRASGHLSRLGDRDSRWRGPCGSEDPHLVGALAGARGNNGRD